MANYGYSAMETFQPPHARVTAEHGLAKGPLGEHLSGLKTI